jgi:DNA phosphorothioation-dependent restriction protein DptG
MEILHELSVSDEYSVLSSIGFNGKIQASDLHRLNDVLDYLMKNFRDEVKLEEIAEIANMSSTSFCRYF